MKKIIYISYMAALGPMGGVLKKINCQTKNLRELGVEIITVVFHMDKKIPKGLKYIEFHKVSSPFIFFGYLAKKIYRYSTKWNYIDHFLSKRSFDFIYMRYPLANFMLEKFVRKYGEFIIFEHQAKEIAELDSWRSFVSFIQAQLEKSYGKRVLQKVKGIIGMSPEVINYELSRIDTFKPHAVISNGINTEEVPLSKRPFYDGKGLSLLFVGAHETPWHGIDRLLRGLAIYRKTTPRINLHLVGNLTNKTKKTVNDLKIGDKVHFHGPTYGKGMDRIFNLAHIAIGTLALHRKQMKQTSSLKIGEYTARGIPFVIAYDDVDLEDSLPFYLKLPAEDSPVDIEKIVSWANNVLKDKDIPFYMREYALKKMDWKVKMKQLKDFLEVF